MKQILDSMRRHTGLTQAESVVVATISVLLLMGWIGRSVFDQSSTHQTQSAERVIALLDSLVADTREASTTTASRAGSPPAPESVTLPGSAPSSRPRRTEVVHPISINRATEQQLTALPGIGPATAAKIVAARAERPFDGVDDLLRVKGIGPKKLERMRPFISVP